MMIIQVIHGLLDRVMQILEVSYNSNCAGPTGYYIKAAEDPSFLKQRFVSLNSMISTKVADRDFSSVVYCFRDLFDFDSCGCA